MIEKSPETMAPAIGVVIVAFHSSEFLRNCIRGVLVDPNTSEVVVVDNSSDRASESVVRELAEKDARVSYLDPRENLGFAKGCNHGADALGNWTHVFFVNPDTQLTKPLSALVDVLNEGYAIVGGFLASPDHRNSVNARPLPTWRREFMKVLIGSRAYRYVVNPSATKTNSNKKVGQVDGALLGMAQDTYQLLGGFDERFELYYEDVDICARAASIGGCVFVPTKWGVHVGGASSARASVMSYCLGRISRVRYLRKYFGNSWSTNTLARLLTLIEFVTRSLTRQSEGQQARVTSVRQQWSEFRSPGAVRLLK